jgi:uncharacterized protein YdeI (BOF family)
MARILVALVFLAAMATPSFAQQGQAPVPPDPTSGAPAQTTPPTFPEGQTSKSTKSQTEGKTTEKSSTSSSKPGKTNVFRGTVQHQDGAFVLKSGDLVYRLDDQEQAKTYEGQKVRIEGNLDRQSNTIKMQSIGPQTE